MGNTVTVVNSRSIINVQVPIGCQLCETGETISCKCSDCDLLMCKRCKDNVHSKFKNATDHRIIDTKDIGKDFEVKLSVVNEFQTELPIVHNVCPCSDDSLWICHTSSSTLQKVKPQGTSLQILSSQNIKVWGMALTPNNDLLLATYKRIKQIRNSTGTIQDSIYNIDPTYIPTSVHVSKDYKVIVGGFRQGRGAVIVMNQTGEHLTVYQQNNQNQPLLTYPRRITSTRNNRIFVTDCIVNDGRGRLVIIDKTGDVKYYYGHPEVNKTKAFLPAGLTTTPNDNVILVDLNTYTLHIFDNSGQLISFNKTLDKGILPYSLGYSPSGYLCIGCSHKDSTDKAKLYQVSLRLELTF